MKQRINLFTIEITNSVNTSGVNRYLSCLVKGLKEYKHISFTWISLMNDRNLIFHKHEKFDSYDKITIPIPQFYDGIMSDMFWAGKYSECVYDIVAPYLENKNNVIIHTNTLNLIDLSNCIKRHLENVKIITHLHCIPWKNHYNNDNILFNRLYNDYYNSDKPLNDYDYLITTSEKCSYNDADRIITQTECATRFLERVMNISRDKITIIPNGMYDDYDVVENKEINNPIEFIYVGSLIESKGLLYILDALRIVQKAGYKVLLHIAGYGKTEIIDIAKKNYSDVPINILGRVPYATLKKYYAKSNIGLIASLQEQTSYVAIEMAMSSLPIITTAIDGLDEMFIDGEDAMKVEAIFSTTNGLSVNTQMMAEKIIELIEDKEKRELISANGRKTYEAKFTLDRMIKQTVEVYESLCN